MSLDQTHLLKQIQSLDIIDNKHVAQWAFDRLKDRGITQRFGVETYDQPRQYGKQESTEQAAAESTEYYTLDRNGIPILAEQHVVFPAPAPPQAQMQTLNLTRRILFGNAMAAGMNPNDMFP